MPTYDRLYVQSIDPDDAFNEILALASRRAPDWNLAGDPSDIGRILVDMNLALFARNAAYVNRLASEAVSVADALDPAILRLHANRHHHVLQTASPGRVVLLLALRELPASDTSIPPETISVRPDTAQSDTLYWNETTATLSSTDGDYTTLPTNQTGLTPGLYKSGATYYVATSFREGRLLSQEFPADNSDSQSFDLDRGDISLDSYGTSGALTVEVSGVPYSRVSSFGFTYGDQQVYRLLQLRTGYRIVFPDRNTGLIPTSGDVVRVTYLTQVKGVNIPANTLTRVASNTSTVLVDGVDQWDPSTGASPTPDVRDQRLSILRTSNNHLSLTSLDSARTLVRQIPGVSRAKLFILGATLYVIVIPDSGGIPDASLLQTVRSTLAERLIPGFGLVVNQPSYVGATITVDVYTDGHPTASLQSYVTDLIRRRLNPLTQDGDTYTNPLDQTFGLDNIGFLLKSIPDEYLVYDYVITEPTTSISVAGNSVLSARLSTITVNVIGGS